MKFSFSSPILAAEKFNRNLPMHQNRLCFPCLPAGRFVTFFVQAKKVNEILVILNGILPLIPATM